jgi:hypothetical protein
MWSNSICSNQKESGTVSKPKQPESRSGWAWIRSLPKDALVVIGAIGVVVGAVLGIIELVGWLTDISEAPIRAEYTYISSPNEGVIIGKFDPNAKYGEEGRVAYSYPFVWVDVTSQAEDETVTLSPHLVVQVTNVRPIPERANYVVYQTGGAGGEFNFFVATLAPEREGVFYAPQQTKDTALGPLSRTLTGEKPKIYDYFTLSPGEREHFRLNITMLPGYYYRFRVGVQHSYKGKEGIEWSEKMFAAGEPLEAEVWVAPDVWAAWKEANAGIIQPSKNSERFQKFGDLQKYHNYVKRHYGPEAATLPRYNRSEVEEVIERQNAAVRESGYPVTPPEQLDAPGDG